MSEATSNPSGQLRPVPSPRTLGDRATRVLWGIVQATVFCFSPRPLHAGTPPEHESE